MQRLGSVAHAARKGAQADRPQAVAPAGLTGLCCSRTAKLSTWNTYSGSFQTCSPDVVVQTWNLGVSSVCVSLVLARYCRSTTASFVILKISSSTDWLMPASHFQIMHLHSTAILSIVLAFFRQHLRSPKRTSAEAFQSSFIAPRARTEPGFLWLTISCNAKTVPFSRQWKECVLYGLSR